MTAEVAVLSRVGVALAADSAVTVATAKVYASADKLFQLSTHAPVGIMIYGNADFLSVPWETVIKLFRQKLGGTTFANLKEYADTFINELRTNAALSTQTAQARFVRSATREILAALKEMIDIRLDENLRVQPQGLLEGEIQQIVDAVVRDELLALSQQPSLDELPDDFGDRFRGRHTGDVAAVASVEMGTLPPQRAHA